MCRYIISHYCEHKLSKIKSKDKSDCSNTIVSPALLHTILVACFIME